MCFEKKRQDLLRLAEQTATLRTDLVDNTLLAKRNGEAGVS